MDARSATRCFAAIALLAAFAGAQQSYPLAYPQDGTGVSQGHVLPLGYNATRRFDESRCQQLIPARYLPSTGTTITGLSVLSASGTTDVVYDRLTIRLSHAQRTLLDSRFDTNLTAPVTVFDQQSVGVQLELDSWSKITFTQPFVYDGTSDLVIDIGKAITLNTTAALTPIVATRVAGNPGRPDLPAPRFAAGPHGSGAAMATHANQWMPTPIAFRLRVSSPTLNLRSDRGGAAGNVFAIGTTMNIDVHAANGSYFAVLGYLGLGSGSPTAPIDGTAYLPVLLAWPIANSAIPNHGEPRTTVPLDIPNRFGLIGFHAGFQAVALDLTTGRMQWTPATDMFVNN